MNAPSSARLSARFSPFKLSKAKNASAKRVLMTDLDFQLSMSGEAPDSNYVLLYQQVASLQIEQRHLLTQYFSLQDNLSISHKSHMDQQSMPQSNEDKAPIIQIQSERASLSSKILELEDKFSPTVVESLENEVAKGKDLIKSLRKQISDINSQISIAETKITAQMLSSEYKKVRELKEQLSQITISLDREKAVNQQLLANHSILKDYEPETKTYVIGEADLISNLNRKLLCAQQKHSEKCQEFIAIRNQQLNEIKALLPS